MGMFIGAIFVTAGLFGLYFTSGRSSTYERKLELEMYVSELEKENVKLKCDHDAANETVRKLNSQILGLYAKGHKEVSEIEYFAFYEQFAEKPKYKLQDFAKK